MNCNDNVLFDSYISEDAWSSVLCSCAWVYVGSCAEKRVWVLGPGRNNPLKLTEIVSGGSRMLAAPIGCQTCEPGDVCVPPCLQLQKLLSSAQGGITSQPPNGQEDERNAQDNSSTARGQCAELWWDSAGTTCRARLPLPPCPSTGTVYSKTNNTAP